MNIVAEIGLSHEGSLGTALKLIDACAHAGADAVKFQCHTGDPVTEFRPETWFPQDASRQDYWRRTAFTLAEWRKLCQRCHDHYGMQFGVSCFSREAVQLMKSVDVDFWKIGSAQLANEELVLDIWETGQPVVMSTGMHKHAEIAKALQPLDILDRLTLLQCTSKYPSRPEEIGLNLIGEYRERFGCKVGLSDHSGAIWPGIVAAYLGADMLEVHVCKSEWDFGPDVKSSLTIEQFSLLCRGARYVANLRDVDKDDMATQLEHVRKLFRA